MNEPAQNTFGYLTFSTLVHSAAALSVILLPQLDMIPEGNMSGDVIEITTTADGPLPLGEEPIPAAAEGNDVDPLPALSDTAEKEAVVVAKAKPAPKPQPQPVAVEPEPELEAPEPRVIVAKDLKDLEPVTVEEQKVDDALAIAEAEEAAIDKALEEQERIEAARDAEVAKQAKEAEALALQEEAAAAALLAKQEKEAQERAKEEARNKAKAEQEAQLAALKAEKEKLAEEKAAFEQKLKDDAEKARQAALAEKARKDLAAQVAKEKAALAAAKKAAAQRSKAQANQQNGAVAGNALPSNKPIGSPQGQIRDYRDIVQLPGNKPPVYPTDARRRRQQGEVKLTYYVQSNGTVSNVRIIQSSGHAALDQEAVAAIRKYRYQPGQAGWALHPVDFQLKGPEEKAFGRLRTQR